MKYIKYLFRSLWLYWYLKKQSFTPQTNNTPEKTVVILGMHRSGTSIAAGICARFGVHMGDKLIRPKQDNQRGFFENLCMIRLNQLLLFAAGGTWQQPPSVEKIKTLSHKWTNKIRQVLATEQRPIFGWKDPRTVLTFPLIESYVTNAHIVFCWRDVESIAKSINKRNNTPIQQAKELAQDYHNRMQEIKKTTHHPFIELHFDDFFTQPEQSIKTIAQLLGVTPTTKQMDDILRFIDPSLRTHTNTHV